MLKVLCLIALASVGLANETEIVSEVELLTLVGLNAVELLGEPKPIEDVNLDAEVDLVADMDLARNEFLYYVVSDHRNHVIGPDVAGQVLAVSTWVHPAWSARIPGATWIWDRYYVSHPNTEQTCWFLNKFQVHGNPSRATLQVAADNSVWTYINGIHVGCDRHGGSFTKESQFQCDVTRFLIQGVNHIQFRVTNLPGGNSPTANPAGLLYKLSIQGFDY